MSKRSFLRKSAMSLTATLGLGGTVAYAADITLNGNTLNVGSRMIDATNALRGAYYDPDVNPPEASFISVAGIRALEQKYKDAGFPNLESDLKVNLDFDQDRGGWGTNPFFGLTVPEDTVNFGTNDSVAAVWSGELVVDASAAGVYGIASASDDGTVMHIDGNYVLNNNFYQGRARRSTTYNLTPGVHSIVMGWYEGGGGANGTYYMSGGPANAPERILNPANPLPGLTFRKVTYTADNTQNGMNVIVTANSGLNITQDTPVTFGSLTMANNLTLNVDSITTASFTGASVGATSTFNVTSGRVQTGALNTGGAVATINKTGGGTLDLNRVAANVPTGSVFNVQGGTLQALTAGSIGNGTVNLSGGTLAINSASSNGVGWSGLESKEAFDAALAGLTPIATRSLDTPNDLEINFPRGDANPDNGGTNDLPDPIFNVDGADLNVALTGNETFIARFAGKLNVTAAGPTRFGLASNDGSAMFLDTDLGAGTNWVKVADNNRFTGTGGGDFQGFNATGDGSNNSIITPQPGPVTLAAGAYDFTVGFFNTQANEAGIELYWVPSGAAAHTLVPGASMTTLNGDFYRATPSTLPFGQNITVTANSGISVVSPNATATNVTLNPGVTLAHSGNPLTITNARAAGAGAVTLASSGVLNLVNLIDDGKAVTFSAGGSGQVFLTKADGPGLGATSSLGATAGGTLVATQVQATNTLGGTPVTLSGGTLELRTGITKQHVSDGPFTGPFIEDAIDPGTTPGSNYLLYRGLTGSDFTVQTTPLIGATARAPVSGIEIRRGNSAIAVKFAAEQPDGPGGDDGFSDVNGPAGVNNTATWNNFSETGQPDVPNQAVPQPLNMDVNGVASPSGATVTWASNNLWSSTGRGEENNTATDPEDHDLMAGYLDTGGVGGVGVTINVAGLPASFTSGTGYDVYVYTKGGINGRGGDFTLGGSPHNFGSNVTATQNSTINVTGAGSAIVGNVSAESGSTLTIQGRRIEVNNVVTGAGGVVAFTSAGGAKVAGSINGAGTLRAGLGVAVDFTGSGAAGSGSPRGDIARGGIFRFAPGASNTFGGAAVTAIANEGLIHATNGITDLSGATVTTTNVPGGFGPGLFGGRVDGAANATDFPVVGNAASVDLRLSRAQTTNNAFFGGDNGTWVYTGEVRLQDTDGDGIPGPVAFGEQFDDYVLLKIEGQEYINNNAWQVPHSSGAIELADTEPDGKGTAGDGWFSFEARFGQGGGGVGPNTGWNIGFGIDTNNANGFDAKSDPATGDPNAAVAQYVEPIEPGNMSLFRIPNNPVRTGNVQVDAGATLRVGALVGSNDVIIAPGARLELHNGTSRLAVSEVLDLPGAPGAATATWDMTDADLVAVSTTATKAADFAALYADLKQGFNQGDWKGLGITSSTARDNKNTDTGVTLVDNALLGLTDFGGQTVDSNSLLLKYTYYGDIDQNGQVDADDLTVFAGNFGRTSGATQVDGDIDFNGTVDADDLTIFANNFNKGIGAPLADAAASVQAVPEPTSLVLAGLGAAGILAGVAVRRIRRPSS